jgi:cell division protein FtsW (lipid II flippase)
MITAVISGQRIALVLVPVIFGILTVLTGQVANLKRFIPVAVGLALLLGVAAVTNPDVTQQRWASFVNRWEASPPQQFIVEQFNQVSRGQHGLLGRGLGRATNSARFLGKTTLLESYYPKVLYEVGPLGVLGFLAVVTMLTFLTFKAYRSVRDRNLRSYGACCWVFVLFVSYNTYYYPLDVDPVAVYYWFIAGVILRLPDLDRQERLQAATPDLPTKRKRRLRKAQEPIPQPST